MLSREHVGEALQERDRRLVPRPGTQLQEPRRAQRTLRTKGMGDLALRDIERNAHETVQLARRHGVRREEALPESGIDLHGRHEGDNRAVDVRETADAPERGHVARERPVLRHPPRFGFGQLLLERVAR